MKCDVCNANEATVHLTEIINGTVTKLHLCEKCARSKSQEMEEHFGLADLLSGLADLVPVVEKKKEKTFPEVTVKCKTCGFTFQNFRKMGRLGCPVCYTTFRAQLNPLLKKIHGSEIHVGKVPTKKEVTRDKEALLAELKIRLEKAIKNEEFEEAARLRDQIRALERRRIKK